MWEVDKNFNFKICILIFSFRGAYLWATATTTMIFDDDDDDDDEGLHVGFFSQSTYNVTSQAKPIFFRNIGHFRNRRVESINNSSVWPPPSIHLVTRRGAMLSVGKASINFSNRSKPFRFYLFLSILLLNRWDEGLGETEVHKKKWKSGLKNSSRS